jgi:hypothetical protein
VAKGGPRGAFVGFGGARLRAVRNPSSSAAADVEGVQSVEMDVLPGDGTVAIDEFVRARAETIRYHEALYRSASLGARGSWLAHPHPLVMTAWVWSPVPSTRMTSGQAWGDTPDRSSLDCPRDRE